MHFVYFKAINKIAYYLTDSRLLLGYSEARLDQNINRLLVISQRCSLEKSIFD